MDIEYYNNDHRCLGMPCLIVGTCEMMLEYAQARPATWRMILWN